MLKEFREFVSRGNVVDLAVALVMGAAFGAIVTSLVDNIIMPMVGVLMGGVDFSTLSITIGNAVIAYGMFIQAIVNFFFISVAMFFLVKAANTMMRKKAEAPPPPAVRDEVKLLTEIRDLLTAQRK
ncbi:MAG: large-conductance mechanosensitive channel protein MscL [Anaerolineales bacterium]|nr:large-conductance mechanosensitive channel protein MscL [Anaerolineales bacterium]